MVPHPVAQVSYCTEILPSSNHNSQHTYLNHYDAMFIIVLHGTQTLLLVLIEGISSQKANKGDVTASESITLRTIMKITTVEV